MSVIHVARLLGIDVQNEPQYLWIAQQASQAQLESEEWKEFTNEQGKTMYYNIKSKKIQAIHPVIANYSRIYQRQKGFLPPPSISNSLTESAERSKFASLVQTFNQRIDDQLPVLTPQSLVDLASLVGVGAKECQLMRTIQATVESYVDKKYDLSTLLEDIREPVCSLRNIYANQVAVAHKPDTVIMCQECEKKSAVLRCESSCQDVFCQECFDTLHATGNRKSHASSQVEQLVCVVCDQALATSQCIQCGTFVCETCFVSMHSSKPDLHAHRRRTVSGLICQECQQAHAAVVCEDCVDLFCSSCYVTLHKNGQRKLHTHVTIDPSGQMFRQGLLVNAWDAQNLLDRARISDENNGTWLKFENDKWEPFWYNLLSEEISTTCP